MAGIKSVLLVCTGNSCRSVMAEGLLKKYLKELGKSNIEVLSAGVNAIDDIRPTAETIEIMLKHSLDVSGFKSRRLTDNMIKDANLILVMAAHHMDDIIRRVPEAVSKTHLLKQFGLENDTEACEDLDILDPIGSTLEVYESVFTEIKKEVERIAELL